MIEVVGLEHQFGQKVVLQVPQLEVKEQENRLILGKSGSGKTTLLHILAGLEHYAKGSVKIAGQELKSYSATQLDKFRAKNIGFVFQKPHLIQTLTVLQNLLIAQYAAKIKRDKRQCEQLLENLGIIQHKYKYPTQLSQGEAQRLSVGRAIINQPQIILADEPTASLDDENTQNVMQLLQQQAQNCKAILIVATHDHRIKPFFEQTLIL